MLEGGRSASEVLSALISNDPEAETRQLAIIDAHGGVAAHTGIECHEWAGHRKPTAGIIWNKLSDGMMNDIPPLQELKLIDL